MSGVPVRPELAEAQPYRWQEGLPTDRPLIRFDMNTQPAPPAWYAGIALSWLLLIASILLFRRRQLRGMRRSAEQALRASEQLYRGIMQA